MIESPRAPAIRLALLLTALLQGVWLLALLPPWMGEDEPWHFANVLHVASGHVAAPAGDEGEFTVDDQLAGALSHLQTRRRFAGVDLREAKHVEDEILSAMRQDGFWRRVDWTGRDDTVESFDLVDRGFTAAHQPPAYYLLAAPLVIATRGRSLDTQLMAVRLLSLALFIGTVLATHSFARRVLDDERAALAAALFVALWPTSAWSAAVANNDVLARFLVAVQLVLAARWLAGDGGRSFATAAGMIVVGAAALATKTTAAGAVAIALVAFLLGGRRAGIVARLFALGLLLAIVVVGVAAWIDAHNPAVPLEVRGAASRLAAGLRAAKLHEFVVSFIGAFNWESRPFLPHLAAGLVGSGALLALVGMASAFARGSPAQRRLLLLALCALGAQLALMMLRGVYRGRYLMPALPALAVFLAAPLAGLVPERTRRAALAAATVALLAFSGWFAWSGLTRAGWLEWRS